MRRDVRTLERPSPTNELLGKIENGEATVAILGLGYVGLPLGVELSRIFATTGFDVDAGRVAAINSGRSYIGDVMDSDLAWRADGRYLRASTDFDLLADADCIIICVPTPLDRGKQPDISYIIAASEEIAKRMRPGQLIVLESTTYPGTTDEVVLPIFLASGLQLGEDFLLAFSPERVDPGNHRYKIGSIPKVVGGCSDLCTQAACALYRKIVPSVHGVSSPRVAETAKLWENTFRSVNIALANEMSLLCRHLGIDTAEVIEAASTKPFGFMPFYPGPGVGGHCIPLDPHYLSWTASRHGYYPRFITLADAVNSEMAEHIVELIADALNDEGITMRGARILVLGVTYKADVADIRMSPAVPIIERLRAKCSRVHYHDSYVARLQIPEGSQPPAPRRDPRKVPIERRQPISKELEAAVSQGRRRSDPLVSLPLTQEELAQADCVVVVTAHSVIDYAWVASTAKLVVDTRNVVPRTLRKSARVVAL